MAGNFNIQTNTGQFLSLAAPGGAIALVDVAANGNQVWDFELAGGNVFTIRNVGQNAFAQSNLAANAQVTGGVAAMDWVLVANGGGFSIRPAANNNFRWNLNGGGVNLLGIAGDLAIQNAQQFNLI